MPARDYPFIELAVHPGIRSRFSSGAGIAVLSPGIDYVHWANGAAARQFGYHSIYAFLEDEAFEETVLARQMKAAAAQISAQRPEQKLMLRLGSGFRRVATPCTLEWIALPDGEPALLLALPPEPRLKDSMARANAMIEGIADAQTHLAVLDGEANALARSEAFDLLGLSGGKLETLVEGVRREPSKLLKRKIETATGTAPAAIADICDAPPLYLLFVVETQQTHDGPAQPETPSTTEVPSSLQPSAQPRMATPAPEALPEGKDPIREQEPFEFDRSGRPIRFVWKIDAEGRFSEVSPEFAAGVGPNAADIVGRSFEEVSQVFDLDRDSTIAELLRRRDTWSGKTVLWPVQGAAMRVPVDLAALPTYSRNRTFDGFRGFGIVRMADSQQDPEKLGLSLQPGMKPSEPDAPSPAEDTAPDERSEAPAFPIPSNDDRPDKAADVRDPTAADGTPPLGEDDPFRGEVPALKIVTPVRRRETDKVIDLDTRRSRGREGLSKIDQAIFSQIGAELGKRLASRDGDVEMPAADALSAETAKAADPKPAEHVESRSLVRPPRPKPAEHVSAVTLKRPVRLPEAESVHARAIDLPNADDAEPAETVFATPSGRAWLTPALVDRLPLALLVHRGDELLHANEAWFQLTGYRDIAEMERRGGLDALFTETDSHAVAVASTDAPAVESQQTLTLVTAEGEAFEVDGHLQSVGWGTGNALLLAISPQASQIRRPQAEGTQSLQIEISELNSILETATDGIVILDRDGRIRSMNGSASALFDYDGQQTRGQPFAMLFAHESQRAVLDYIASLSDNGVASVLNDGREVIGREASGGFIPLFMTIGRLNASDGYCAVIRDITHWKRTEEELRAAKREAETANAHKSDFLARVSHEIRTPLNAIIGFSEMMATERFGPIGSPRYLEYAHDIGKSGRHVLDIVNDLLDISKIEAGQQHMDFAAVSLNEILAECVSLLQPQANAQRIIIRTSLANALPEVVADQRSLKQIAINLLSNAIRFTPSGGQIVVSTAYDASGRVTIRFRDSGIGMSRTEMENAMKPFRQGATSPSRPRGDGTGLGLPLTKAMVEANRADFRMDSTPGEGTLVQIVFPPQRVLAD